MINTKKRSYISILLTIKNNNIMSILKKRMYCYVVYTRFRYGCTIYKNLKNLCEIEEYQLSIHTLYKFNFDADYYSKGEITIYKQYIY